MLLYAAMPAGFALLCRGCLKTNNALICVVGSILSCVASVTAAKLTGLEPMGHYFKPFTSHSLIAVLSFASIVIHIIIITVVRAKK